MALDNSTGSPPPSPARRTHDALLAPMDPARPPRPGGPRAPHRGGGGGGAGGLLREQADAYVGLAEWCAAQGLPGDALGEWGRHSAWSPTTRGPAGWDAPPASPARDAAKKHGAATERREKLEAGFLKPTLALGKRLAAAGDAEGAAAAFRRALDLDPESAEAHQGLGEALVKGVGWFPKATAEKLKAGQRELDGEWKPKAEVEKERRRWDRAWEVRDRALPRPLEPARGRRCRPSPGRPRTSAGRSCGCSRWRGRSRPRPSG